MSKGIAIAALIIMLLSFPVPVLGTWIGYFALILAAIAALLGNKTFVVATIVIGAVKMFVLSPGLMATMYLPFADKGAPVEAYFPLILTTGVTALPIICLIFRAAIRRVLGMTSNEA